MKTDRQRTAPDPRFGLARRDGIALVITLGMLSVLMLLAVAFAVSMRVERIAARNHADVVRARQLVWVGLTRAIEALNTDENNILGKVYPGKSVFYSDEAAGGYTNATLLNGEGLLMGEASNWVPGSVWAAAEQAQDDEEILWSRVLVGENEKTNGRVAYISVDCSGLLDVNVVGGGTNENVDDISAISLAGLPETLAKNKSEPWKAEAKFYTNRVIDVRYETLPELWALNRNAFGIPSENLFVWSLDPGMTFKGDTGDLGRPDANVTRKMNLNGFIWTNEETGVVRWLSQLEIDKMSLSEQLDFYDAMLWVLEQDDTLRGGEYERTSDIAWNILNYLDTNHIPEVAGKPQCDEAEGADSCPLISEVIMYEISGGVPGYGVRVEVWYPFYPTVIDANEFGVIVDIFNAHRNENPEILRKSSLCVYTREFLIDREMKWIPDLHGDFFVCDTGELSAIADVFADGKIPRVRATVFSKRASKPGSYVYTDMVPGARSYVDADKYPNSNGAIVFEVPGSFAVDDPRKNDFIYDRQNDVVRREQVDNWTRVDGPSAGTPGEFNEDVSLCYGPARGKSKFPGSPEFLKDGLPIFVRNGPMQTIGEFGFIWRSNPLGMEKPPDYWLSIDMFHESGANLLKYMTVAPTNRMMRGRVNLNTPNRAVLEAVLHGLEVSGGKGLYTLSDERVETAVKAMLDREFLDLSELTELKDELSDCFNRDTEDDIAREAVLRRLIGTCTTEQNIFTIIVAAQAIAPDGWTPVAEQKAAAVVWRDPYNGTCMLRSMKWLTE